jgi:hypothetical protein
MPLPLGETGRSLTMERGGSTRSGGLVGASVLNAARCRVELTSPARASFVRERPGHYFAVQPGRCLLAG